MKRALNFGKYLRFLREKGFIDSKEAIQENEGKDDCQPVRGYFSRITVEVGVFVFFLFGYWAIGYE